MVIVDLSCIYFAIYMPLFTTPGLNRGRINKGNAARPKLRLRRARQAR